MVQLARLARLRCSGGAILWLAHHLLPLPAAANLKLTFRANRGVRFTTLIPSMCEFRVLLQRRNWPGLKGRNSLPSIAPLGR